LVAGSVVVALLVLVVLTATEPDRRFPGLGDPGWVGDVLVGVVAAALVVGVVAIPALLLLRAAGRPATARRPPGLRSMALTVLAVLAPLTVGLLLASALGAPEPEDQTVVEAPGGPGPAGEPDAAVGGDAGTNWTVAGAVAVGLVVALLAGAVALRRERPQEAVARTDGEPARAEGLEAVEESLDALLGEPDHRRAVVAAYSRMERLFAGRGVPRGRSETGREHVDRALRDLGAPADVTAVLADRFEAARFSDRPVGPDDRRAAVDALTALRDALGATPPAVRN
jgi:hypothetical protein